MTAFTQPLQSRETDELYKPRSATHINIRSSKIYPELIKKVNEGYLSVNYANFSTILIEAIKEQQTMIDKQNKQI